MSEKHPQGSSRPVGTPHTADESAPIGEPDSEKLQLLFLRHSQTIRAYVRGLTPPQLDPEEIFQETFLVAMRKTHEFRPGAKFLPWVFGIARIKVMRYTYDRRDRGENTLAPEVLDLLAESIDQRDQIDDQLSALRRCIERLSHTGFRMMKLFYFEGMSGKEIGARLGVKVRSVYTGLDRTRLQLRECIERELAKE